MSLQNTLKAGSVAHPSVLGMKVVAYSVDGIRLNVAVAR